MSERFEGLLLVDKPEGPTSHDVVARIRARTGQRRVGHAGTLDPPASGLLPVVLGRATRLVRFLPQAPKVYSGTLQLGLTTSSDDVTGEVRTRHAGALPDAGRVREAARDLTGRSLQRPPAVSARKIDGQRSYRLARMGLEPATEARPVEVTRFDLEPTDRPEIWNYLAEVSSGTYIRSLARDLGDALGCGAAVGTLRRLSIGAITLERARPLAALCDAPDAELAGAIVPISRMPLLPPVVTLTDPQAIRGFVSGVAAPAPTGPAVEGFCRVLDGDGRLLGVAEASTGLLRPRVVVALPPAEGDPACRAEGAVVPFAGETQDKGKKGQK